MPSNFGRFWNPGQEKKEQVQKVAEDKRMIKFVTNQQYMEEKFQKIEQLTKKLNAMKSMLRNPEITVLLLLDLIEGNY
jgi:hypothetical protein